MKNIDNCEEYSEDGSCTKCATSYNVLYNKCLKNIDNCDQYLEDGACSKCSSGYTYYSNNNSNKCIKAIDNCEEYSEDEACQKCSNNYAFKESARDACYPKTDLENYYYTRDQGISYYQCSEHCKKCRYEENPNLRTMCDLCDDGFYVYVRDETCIAYDSSTKTMAIANETHIDDCNQFISDCQTCEDKNACIKCSTNTIISDKVTCVNDAELNVEHYYLSGEKTYYDCTNSKYNDIQNCYICSNKESCTQCQNGYTFLDGDKTNCAQIESLENEYILDSADKTNYISCSKIYENCQACDKDKCLTCKEGFVFVNNDFSKCSVEDNGGIPVISKDEAEKLASISLSYEQINNFNYDSNNNKITFDLSTLTTVGEANIGDEIKVYVNLIYNSGTADVKSTESSCVAQNIEEQSGSARVKFVCTIENLKADDYYSLRYNTSESICGVPKDEISLDPVLTNKYKSSVATKILPTFTPESIDYSSCPSNGILTISGKVTEKLNEAKKINIKLKINIAIIVL